MWDKRYSSEHYVYGVHPNEFLERHVNLIPKGQVLCLAEGEGRNAVFLARQGFQVTAVDTSSVGLKKAGLLADKYDVSIDLVVEDLNHFDFGVKRWDGIVSIFCHLPPSSRKAIHQKVVAGLKKGGVFLLEAFTPDQLQHGTGGPPTEELMVSEGELIRELTGLRFDHLQEIERSVIEGTLHTGTSAVVQAIAVKL